MLKRFSIFLLLFSVISAMACQYTQPPGTSWPDHVITYTDENCSCVRPAEMVSYIVGINWFKNRFYEDTLNSFNGPNGKTIKLPTEVSSVRNDIVTGLPITLWFSLHTKDEYEGEVIDADLDRYMTDRFVSCKLYYKVIPSGKSYDNPSCKWRLGKAVEFPEDAPASYTKASTHGDNLFGNNSLSLADIINNGDAISAGDTIYFIWYFMDKLGTENIEEIEIGKAQPYIEITDGVAADHYFSVGSQYILSVHCISVIYDGSTVYGR